MQVRAANRTLSRLVAVVVVAFGAPISAHDSSAVRWETAAFRWISEVAHPGLEQCVSRFGGRGAVEIRVNEAGGVAARAVSGDAIIARCVDVLSHRWRSSSFEGGYLMKLTFPDRTQHEGDEVAWRSARPPFSPCDRFEDCGAGQVCEGRIAGMSADGGVCIDTIESWRLRADAGVSIGPKRK